MFIVWLIIPVYIAHSACVYISTRLFPPLFSALGWSYPSNTGERTTAYRRLSRHDKGTEMIVWLRIKSGEGELITSTNSRTRVSREERTVSINTSTIYVNTTPIYVTQTNRRATTRQMEHRSANNTSRTVPRTVPSQATILIIVELKE